MFSITHTSVTFLKEGVIEKHVGPDETAMEYINFGLSQHFGFPGGPLGSMDGPYHVLLHQIKDDADLRNGKVA